MMAAKKRWPWMVALAIALCLIIALTIYKYPVRLETLLPQEFSQANNIAEIHVKESLSSPYFDYDYVLNEPQEIEAVLDYLKEMKLSRRVFTPNTRTITSPQQYIITLIRNDGTNMALILDDILICTGEEFVGKQFTVVNPKSYDKLHEAIAGSPAWWDQ